MANRFKAQIVPYSSVVGGGVMLLDKGGACVGQVMFMRHSVAGFSKEEQEHLSAIIADAINKDAQTPALTAGQIAMLAQLEQEHRDEMTARGRDPDKYMSQWGQARDTLRKLWGVPEEQKGQTDGE